MFRNEVTLSLREARDRVVVGLPVTFVGPSAPGVARPEGARTGADGWFYATVRMNPLGETEWKAPGSRAWRRVSGAERGESVHGQALALAMAVLFDNATTDRGLAGRGCYLLRAVACSACGEELTTPDSIQAGAGPVCRGEESRRAVKRSERKALASMDVATMRQKIQGGK